MMQFAGVFAVLALLGLPILLIMGLDDCECEECEAERQEEEEWNRKTFIGW